MKRRMKAVLAAALAGIVFLGAGCGGDSGKSSGEGGKLKIGVVQIMQHGSLDEANR